MSQYDTAGIGFDGCCKYQLCIYHRSGCTTRTDVYQPDNPVGTVEQQYLEVLDKIYILPTWQQYFVSMLRTAYGRPIGGSYLVSIHQFNLCYLQPSFIARFHNLKF